MLNSNKHKTWKINQLLVLENILLSLILILKCTWTQIMDIKQITYYILANSKWALKQVNSHPEMCSINILLKHDSQALKQAIPDLSTCSYCEVTHSPSFQIGFSWKRPLSHRRLRPGFATLDHHYTVRRCCSHTTVAAENFMWCVVLAGGATCQTCKFKLSAPATSMGKKNQAFIRWQDHLLNA